MPWFVNNGGVHQVRATKQLVKHGESFEEDLPLDEMFPNKFSRAEPPPHVLDAIRDQVRQQMEAEQAESLAAAASAEPAKPAGPPADGTTEDRTDDFSGAKEAGFVVMGIIVKGKAKYNIFDKDNLKTPVNEHPLTGPKAEAKLAELGVKGVDE